MHLQMGMVPRLEQRLKMTAQMIQSIQMLQVPLMQLQQEVNQHLVENPVLELEEEEIEREAGSAEDDEKGLEIEDDFGRLARISEEEDWHSYLSGDSRPARRFDGEPDAKLDAMQNTAAPSMTLRDALLTQLHLSGADDDIAELGEQIVQSIDDNGYLQSSIEDIFNIPVPAEGGDDGQAAAPGPESNGVTIEHARKALKLVQSFDPPGIGARDVPECLLLQLDRDSGACEFETLLIRDHFDDLLNNRLPKVAKETGASIEQVKEAIEIIGLLNPKPGMAYSSGRPQRYIIPDVMVEELDGEYEVKMNESGTPRLRISKLYRDLMMSERRGSATRDYIRERIQAAKWLIDAIEQRRNTLYKIACEIVGIQQEFFDKGLSSLKPLQMQEVADRIGMHVSTVSRALTEKYMDTPRGVFPMKYFFTGGFESSGGAAESNRTVMARIQEMVAAEDRKKPLSDQEIATRLKGSGIDIARRTIAKYREKLGILSSRQRKEY